MSQDGSGGLCTQGRGLAGARGVVVSPDNLNVYVASEDNSALAVFSRNTTTGALMQLSGPAGCIANTGGDPTCAAGVGLDQVVFVSVSPDGYNVYAAAQVSNAVSVFSRNATTGALTQLSGLEACVSSDGTGGKLCDWCCP